MKRPIGAATPNPKGDGNGRLSPASKVEMTTLPEMAGLGGSDPPWERPARVRGDESVSSSSKDVKAKDSAPGPSSSGAPLDALSGNGPRVSGLSSAGILSPESKFGVYRIGACIGEGGMARIYQAEHAGLRRQVALKVLIDGFPRDSEGRERFLREARIAAAIKHPNVVNIFDVGVHEDIPYLVMELLEGKDLEKLLESRRPLEEGLIIDIMVPVVAGLIAVHDAGIVHRDLKPGNIFLARGRHNDLEPRLLDFGISKAPGPDQLKLTANRTLMGTPFYISPEGLRGGEMTPLSDQYSLAVVMYECATGATPFAGSTFVELSNLIQAGKYVPPCTQNPELSKRLARIIERAMSLRPEDRFRDLREMGRELLGLAGQRTRITWGLTFGDASNTLPSSRGAQLSRNRPSGDQPASPPPGPKRNARILGAIVSLSVLGIGLAAWLSRTGARAPTEAIAPPAVVTAARVATTGGTTADTVAAPPVDTNAPGGRSAAETAPVVAAGSSEKNTSRTRAARAAPEPAAARPNQRAAGSASRRASGSSPEPEPDWALPSVNPPSNQNKSSEPRTSLGTNGAPIFD